MGIATSPTLDARVIHFIGRTSKILIDGKWSDAASRKNFRHLQSGDRRGAGAESPKATAKTSTGP